MIVESKEIELLFRAVKDTYGYDLESFSSDYSKRRIREFVKNSNLTYVCELIPKILLNDSYFYQMLNYMTINYTEFFRDSSVFIELREKLVPRFKTYPNLKIWHVGCSTGAEPYSLAILLHEEGLLDNTLIYATDMNHQILSKACMATFPLEQIMAGEKNYLAAGGKKSLTDYFSFSENRGTLNSEIRSAVTFAHHNIISDTVFGEMNAIFFRNVLIYFNDEYQNRALKTVTESLMRSGFLVLGDKESLYLKPVRNEYDQISQHYIYQKKQEKC